MAHPPVDLLAVASWFPSRMDPISGRFIQDQLEAVAATGRVRPAVVTFEAAELIGSGSLRSRTAAAVGTLAGDAVRTADPLFLVPSGAGIPVARLTVPSGRHPVAGTVHAAVAREGALDALADRFRSGAEHDVATPRVIHGHTVYPDGVGAAVLAARLDAALVLTEHASFVDRLVADPAIRDRYERTVQRAARLVVVSRTLGRELEATLPSVASKISVIPNAVPIDAYRPADGVSRTPDELVFVGYRKASKGIATLLRSFATVRGRRPSARLRLVGSSPTAEIERGWHDLARELGIGEAVEFAGPADRAGVAAALARASVFVHPSPRETFGVVAVEALAAGIPVVAVDSGGVTEILGNRPDRLGRIVSDDAAALAEGIVDVLDRIETFDPAVLRTSVMGRFDEETVAARLADLYDEILRTPAVAAVRAQRPRPSSSPRRVGPPDTAAHGISRDTPTVVVALDPDRAATVERLSPEVRSAIVLVTSSPVPPAIVGAVAAVVETELHGRIRALADAATLGPPVRGVRRWVRALRHPVAVARRRGLLPGLEGLVTKRGSAAVRDAAGRARALRAGTTAGPADPTLRGLRDALVPVVCIDGLDHLAAAVPIRQGEVRLIPGGLRRLGDEA